MFYKVGTQINFAKEVRKARRAELWLALFWALTISAFLIAVFWSA